MTKIIKKTKPRLSMKLLYKILATDTNVLFIREAKDRELIRDFLEYAEKRMKPLKP